MANEQNLVRGDAAHKLTVEEASRGGKASVEARRRKRDLRKALEILLEKDFTDKNGKVACGAEVLATKLFETAMKGNVKAFTALRDTVGQMPVQKIETTVVSDETRAEIEAFLDDESEAEETTKETEE